VNEERPGAERLDPQDAEHGDAHRRAEIPRRPPAERPPSEGEDGNGDEDWPAPDPGGGPHRGVLEGDEDVPLPPDE